MNAFPYTNPYSQPVRKSSVNEIPETAEALLHRLETVSRHNLKAFLQQLLTTRTHFEWNLSNAIRLVDWILNFIREESERNEHDDSLVATILLLLTKCLDVWDDRIVYAAAVHQEEDDSRNDTLLQVLEMLCLCHVTDNSHEVQFDLLCAAALSALTSAWESLDRLHQITTCLPFEKRDSVYWITNIEASSKWRKIVMFVVKVICGNLSTNKMSQDAVGTRPEEWKATCASFLVQLLQHEQLEWIYLLPGETLEELISKISTEASRLLDRNMPSSSYTKMSLMSLQLWIALCQVRGAHADEETGRRLLGCLQELIDPLVCASFATKGGSGHGPGHRWAQVQQSTLPLSVWCRAVISMLCQFSFSSLKDNVAAHPVVRQSAEVAWKCLLKPDDDMPISENILHLLVLHGWVWSATRDSLKELVERHSDTASKMDVCRQIPSNLLKIIRTHDCLWAAGLLAALLNDGRQQSHHDEISRTIWGAIDGRLVSQLMELTLSRQSRSSASDYHGPEKICILDSLHIVFKMQGRLCQEILNSLSAETVESLVTIMLPKVIRMEVVNDDCVADATRLVESEESTPPAHNLSRIAETSMFVEEDQRPRGMDPIIRMTAASVLAAVGSFPLQDEEGHALLLQRRMCESVLSFASETKLSMAIQNGGDGSLEMTQRRLRLISSLSHPRLQDHLARVVHAAENTQRRHVQGLFEKVDRRAVELRDSRKREQKFRAEKEVCERRLIQESMRLQREKDDLQRKLMMDSDHQIAVHWGERQKAEKQVMELSKRLQEADSRAAAAEATASSCRVAEEQARSQLKEATKKLMEVESRERELCQRVESSEHELSRVSNELESTLSAYKRVSKNEKELQERVRQLDSSVAQAEESEDTLRESLESLFADMVCIARLYEYKEKEVASYQHNNASTVDELKRKLKAEQKRNAEIQEHFEQVKYENEVLSQKYAKVREKLDRERKRRHKETEQRKRTGTVSYIDQLQHSTASGRSSSSVLREWKGNESNRSVSTSHRSRSSSRRYK